MMTNKAAKKLWAGVLLTTGMLGNFLPKIRVPIIPKKKTGFDNERIAAAEAKRERKMAKRRV